MTRTIITMAKEALLLLYLFAAILVLFVLLSGCVTVTCDSHSEGFELNHHPCQERD